MAPDGRPDNYPAPEDSTAEPQLSDDAAVARLPLSDNTLTGEDPVSAPEPVASPARTAAPELPVGENIP
ncbi:MAG TPA: hypothetical protein PLX03_14030, partial [Candidatus Hydrogenedentes bacterium]|nr:hypothetical protein [Candidatus Hydrogenedentota bacterium]